MKLAHFVLVLSMLFAASFLLAQKVEPTSLSFEAVPPNTSPQEGVAFTNTGTTTLSLTVYVSGPPFAISENRCGNGVKPNSHCNLYLTYTPQVVGEVDNGTLTINYGEGVATVALSGNGVSSIPTWAHLGPAPHQCLKVQFGDPFSMLGKVGVEDKYYALPTGEPVYFSCTNGQATINFGPETLEACDRHCPSGPYDYVEPSFTPSQVGSWTCTMTYDGDGILGANSAQVDFEVGTHYKHRSCGK